MKKEVDLLIYEPQAIDMSHFRYRYSVISKATVEYIEALVILKL
jgi:hypothetical protein